MARLVPQPPACNACQLSHTPGLASSAFARHYSRNHNCFLFLWVLRCFTSPRSLQPPYIFRWRSPDITRDIRGFPIRTSTDQSSFTNSPWLIAGYNVLHRLLMPRHPPIALSSLSPNKTINNKNLLKDARVHYTILKQQTNTHPNRPHKETSQTSIVRTMKQTPSHATTPNPKGLGSPSRVRAKVSEPNNVHTPHTPHTPPVPHPPHKRIGSTRHDAHKNV